MADHLLSWFKKFVPRPIFRTLQPWYHLALAFLAVTVYRFPSRSLIVIGVTGTDGKTTVVHLLHEIFYQAGHRVGSLSSLRFKINDREEVNYLKMTMPGRFRLQKFLAECREAGCRFVILEVTSQGIKQYRHRFIRFRVAVLTNISPEHIESHGGFGAYRAAKIELFQRLPPDGLAILNREDPSAELFAAATRAEVVWYSRSDIELKRVGHPVRVVSVLPTRIQLEVENVFFETSLGGAFNVSNILAAVACAMAFDVSLSAIAQALGRVGAIPGRLEYVQREPFAVVVDYAQTPKAHEAVYQALIGANAPTSQLAGRQAAGTSKLICVFGAAGGRDRWKRPELGKIASRYCGEIILTSDDPDEENPARIAAEIHAGVANLGMSSTSSGKKHYSPSKVEEIPLVKIVLDRREAIREAIRDARPGDTVIITGMGAQPWLIVKGKKIPWDDRRVVREELSRSERWRLSG